MNRLTAKTHRTPSPTLAQRIGSLTFAERSGYILDKALEEGNTTQVAKSESLGADRVLLRPPPSILERYRGRWQLLPSHAITIPGLIDRSVIKGLA
jgi:hypothetical protein